MAAMRCFKILVTLLVYCSFGMPALDLADDLQPLSHSSKAAVSLNSDGSVYVIDPDNDNDEEAVVVVSSKPQVPASGMGAQKKASLGTDHTSEDEQDEPLQSSLIPNVSEDVQADGRIDQVGRLNDNEDIENSLDSPNLQVPVSVIGTNAHTKKRSKRSVEVMQSEDVRPNGEMATSTALPDGNEGEVTSPLSSNFQGPVSFVTSSSYHSTRSEKSNHIMQSEDVQADGEVVLALDNENDDANNSSLPSNPEVPVPTLGTGSDHKKSSRKSTQVMQSENVQPDLEMAIPLDNNNDDDSSSSVPSNLQAPVSTVGTNSDHEKNSKKSINIMPSEDVKPDGEIFIAQSNDNEDQTNSAIPPAPVSTMHTKKEVFTDPMNEQSNNLIFPPKEKNRQTNQGMQPEDVQPESETKTMWLDEQNKDGQHSVTRFNSQIPFPTMRTKKEVAQETDLKSKDFQPEIAGRTDSTSAAPGIQMATQLDDHVSIRTKTGYSQLDVSAATWSERFRSYVHEWSANTVIVVAISAFIIGTMAALLLAPYFISDGALRSDFISYFSNTVPMHLDAASGAMLSEDDLEAIKLRFDFETQDAKSQKMHRWEWCTLDEVRQLGILTQAATEPFQGYKRIDVAPSHADVQELLSSHSMPVDDEDLQSFNFARDGEDLLWKLLRAEAFFMLGTKHPDLPGQKLLLMMETVRLRLTDGGRVLIQKRDNTLLAQETCLPGQMKAGSDPPLTAAKQMWQEVFKLPLDIASFVEISVEDKEIVGFEGLQCVERRHIIEVKLHPLPRTIDINNCVINKVGLPMHRGFCCSGMRDRGVGGGVVRNFAWMTMDECEAAGIMKNDFGASSDAVSVLDLTSQDGMTCEEKLSVFLQHASVDTESSEWQGSGDRTSKLHRLATELSSGKCSLTSTPNGVHYCVNVVAMRLWSPDRELLLVEKGQKHASGGGECILQLPWSEKDCNESLMEATMRVCEEQLGFTRLHVAFGDDSDWEYSEYTEPSSCYNGLLTKYQKFFVDMVLEEDDELWRRVGLSGKAQTSWTRLNTLSDVSQ